MSTAAPTPNAAPSAAAAASTDLPKAYEPASVEAEAYRVWLDEKLFHAEPADPGDPYSIVIPPPNVTGALHLGHAINNTLQDILTRAKRMMGFNAVWIPGIDHAGIATQAVVEKQLKEQENKTRHDVGREALVHRIWAWKEQYGDRILSQLQRLGCSCDWDRTRFTLDDTCARAVRHTFFKLFKDGLIYRGKRLVNWDVHLQTSISDDEIYHETVKTSLWHIRYPIVDAEFTTESTEGTEGMGKEQVNAPGSASVSSVSSVSSVGSVVNPDRPKYMTVATTRPETMLGDTAVAVHSEDPRWNWAIGKFVELPLTGRRIPIIADDILVDPKFGSGVVKVTPAHDPNDYAVWQRHQGKPDQIDITNILNPDGTLNDSAGAYKGMKRDAARKKVVADLEHQGLLAKEEPYETQVGHSDRSKTPIEPYLSDQWFVHMAPLAEPALEVVRNGTIKFFPERHAQQYLSWLGEKRDWPISRQLWWGHRIPVWTHRGKDTKEIYAFLHPADGSPKPHVRDDLAATFEPLWDDQGEHGRVYYVCVPPDRPDLERKLEELGFQQDPDVLDTWFSSALWPHSTLGWPEETAALAKWYPTSVLLTGRDIITLWVARMVMTGLYNMGQIPFAHVAINPTILDAKGERMSKTKGNGVDPVDVIETHGADALRFTLTSMATETQDVRMLVQLVCPHCDSRSANPEHKDPQVKCPKCGKLMTRPMGTAVGTVEAPLARATSDKFDLGRNFANKLWNASRFVLSNLEALGADAGSAASAAASADPSQWSVADRWILSRLARSVRTAEEAMATYRFDQYAAACYDFFWRDLCDWYIEAVKLDLRAGSPRRAQTAHVLATALDGALRLMHPVIPFITETIWWRLNAVRPERGLPGKLPAPPSKRLIKAAWPKPDPSAIDEAAEATFGTLQALIGAIRNLRNEHKVEPRRTIAVSIAAPARDAKEIEANRGVIELLATCTVGAVAEHLPPPKDAARATAGAFEVYAEGLVDADAERQRLSKRRDELAKQIAALKGRLANPSYTEKAPPHLVEQTRDQLAAAEAELAKLT